MKTAKELLIEKLIEIEADGLFNKTENCACSYETLEGFIQCDDFSNCIPAKITADGENLEPIMIEGD